RLYQERCMRKLSELRAATAREEAEAAARQDERPAAPGVGPVEDAAVVHAQAGSAAVHAAELSNKSGPAKAATQEHAAGLRAPQEGPAAVRASAPCCGLPAEWEEDSPLRARLAEVRRRGSDEHDLQDVRRSIESDLLRIRGAASRASSGRSPSEEDYARALLGELAISDFDDVLCYCLDQLTEAKKFADHFKAKAFRRYIQCPDAYDLILADLLPADVRRQARQGAQEQAYDQGTNTTAQPDFAVCPKRFEARMRSPSRAVATGLKGLDAALGGGLRGLGFLGGASGKGKTSLALQISMSALAAHPLLAVLFVMLDDIPCDEVY